MGKVGGQAVLEGVMMKSGDDVCLCVRQEDKTIARKYTRFVSVRKKHKILNLPLIRGVVNMVEMMKLSMGTMSSSAELLGIDETEPETKFEKWLSEKLGKGIMPVIMGISTVLGLVLSIFLFVFLPTFATKGISFLAGGELNWLLRAVIEGVLKIGIFVLYIALVGLMPDIKRTFQYHGAEHKSVACYERGLELTPANAATCTRFHPRCGTSFIFVMLILSIFVSMFIRIDFTPLRSLVKLLLLPISVGLGYEYIMYAGKHDNVLTHILSAPGLWMQRLTTKDPDETQLEVAITALKGALSSEFPEFSEESYKEQLKAAEEEKSQQEEASQEETEQNEEDQPQADATDDD